MTEARAEPTLGERGYRDPRVSAKWLIAATAFEALVGAGRNVAAIGMFRFAGGPAFVDDRLWFELHNVLELAGIAGWLAAGVAFTVWVRRIIRNSWLVRAPAIYRSRWSGLWMLVPVAQYWMPFLIVCDLWHGTRAAGARHPPAAARVHVYRGVTPPLIAAWWVTLVGASAWHCIQPLRLVLTAPHIPELAQLIPSGIGFVYVWLTYRVTIAVSERQNRQRDVVDSHDDVPPPARAERTP